MHSSCFCNLPASTIIYICTPSGAPHSLSKVEVEGSLAALVTCMRLWLQVLASIILAAQLCCRCLVQCVSTVAGVAAVASSGRGCTCVTQHFIGFSNILEHLLCSLFVVILLHSRV